MSSFCTDYYRLVPKGLAANLRFRAHVLRIAAGNKEVQQGLWIACKRDPLFYINTFVWTFDPRSKEGKLNPTIPFVTYPFQDDLVGELIGAVYAGEDRAIVKTRDVGGSWCCLAAIEWFWHFWKDVSFLIGSRKEEYVEKTGDPKALFSKIDKIHECQPGWLKPLIYQKKLHRENLELGGTIDGESTNEDFARGDRRTAIFLDEFPAVENGNEILAATSRAADCRIFLGTPKGMGNAFATCCHNKTMKVIDLHWTRHPIYGKGSYRDKEGKLRSPWYDAECKRLGDPRMIAQELDRDFFASDAQFFVASRLEELKDKCHPPFSVGELDYDVASGQPLGFLDVPNGALSLWCLLDGMKNPAQDRSYCMGIDVSAGTKDQSGRGASNSAICVIDLRLREQVAEYVVHGMLPEEFAGVAAALGRWFCGGDGREALIIWEDNGPGGAFGQQLREQHGYRNVWKRLSARKKKTEIPGWWSTPQTKYMLFASLRRAMGQDFLIRSAALLDECMYYKHHQGGRVVHSRAVTTTDESQARDAHGDRVVAAAVAWLGATDLKRPDVKAEAKVPYGCLAWRQEQAGLSQEPETRIY